MSFVLHPLQVVLAALSENIRKQQQEVIEYLQVENQILREKLGNKRVLLSDDQRRLLAVSGKALGRKRLEQVSTIAQADTILRWHRELIEYQGECKGNPNSGRPPVEQEVVELVLRMASENETWGYRRIEGAMQNIGFSICKSTVANILRQHGIPPAPTRKRQLSWCTFAKAHMDVFEGIDWNAIVLWLKHLTGNLADPTSPGKDVPCPEVGESSEERPCPIQPTIRLLQIPGNATHHTRAPPSICQPYHATRDTRYAA